MSSHTGDLLTGLAGSIASAGIGTYLTGSSVFTAGQTGIGIGQLPETTDRAIAITDYGTAGDEITQAITTIAVQVLCRSNRNDRLDLASLRDSIFQLLQGMTHVNYGTCHVIQARRISSVPLGLDENDRWLQADNYYFDCNTPASAYRS